MKKLGLLGILLAVLILASAVVSAEEAVKIQAVDLKIMDWPGTVFQVLPLELDQKEQGYSMFTLVGSNPALLNDHGSIRADWMEGRKLEVLSVRATGGINDNYEVSFRESESGVVMTSIAMGNQVAQVIRYEDLVNARARFLGKTIFRRDHYIREYRPYGGSYVVRIDEPLKVVDVVPGVSADEPIWLVVTTGAGQKGYIGIAFSNTNAYSAMTYTGLPWESKLLEANPRETYKWDEDTWKAVNAGELRVGMNPDQVRLAWGDPSSSARRDSGEEVWYYPTKLVTFVSGTLVTIQDR